ncbi:MAG: threonine ammonia-lyase, partial [Muribaculaceae bacterium]|nr:threonine ammonia-lyase [Muribaculaceae bacterium]
VKSGRNCTLTLDLFDKPGQLSGVCGVIGKLGGNVISVTHERNNDSTSINGCMLRVEIETRNADHIAEIRNGLSDAGYHLVG